MTPETTPSLTASPSAGDRPRDLASPADLAGARSWLAELAQSEAAASGWPVVRLAVPVDPVVGSTWPALPVGPAVVVADGVLTRAGLANLRLLATDLGPDRALWYLEPTAEVGWRSVAHRLGRPLWRATAGHGFEVDTPAVLRSVGLRLTDVDRFGTGPAGLFSWVLGRAVTQAGARAYSTSVTLVM